MCPHGWFNGIKHCGAVEDAHVLRGGNQLILIDYSLVFLSALLLLPAIVFAVECVAALFERPSPLYLTKACPRFTIVVPAHNEGHTIGETVCHLLKQIDTHGKLVVVADNCSDETASEAKIAGANVWTRTDAQKKGKGYAIEFAVERLKDDPPEVVIIIDSDCRVSSGAINLLSRAAATYRRPIQALYLMDPPAVSSVLTYVSTFAYLVRNLVRPVGLHKLGFPCHLTGTGMAFVWEQLLTIPPQRSNLVEDLSMGLEAAINGYPPLLLKEAEVHSEFPESLIAAAAQRRRWEHGQLAAASALVPRLVIEGVRQRRVDILGLAADLIVPPLSLLVLIIGAATLTSLMTYMISGSPIALTINLLALLLVGLTTIAIWVRFARKVIPGRALVLAPFYILWKLPSYAALLIGRRQKAWIRTERTSGKCRSKDNKNSDATP